VIGANASESVVQGVEEDAKMDEIVAVSKSKLVMLLVMVKVGPCSQLLASEI